MATNTLSGYVTSFNKIHAGSWRNQLKK